MINGRKVLSPSEPGGGAWVAVNDAGITFALINWYAITSRVKADAVSRGEVVNAVCSWDSPVAASASLKKLPLARINPFRLVGIFPAAKGIFEWRWDLKRLDRWNHGWRAQQWISSGYDEPTAQRMRGKTFREAMKQKSAGGLDWLRRLHRSHAPQAGPFSTCMHRADAATVSFTEVAVSRQQSAMRHHGGPPCERSEESLHTLQFKN
jgi:hypothetical protein